MGLKNELSEEILTGRAKSRKDDIRSPYFRDTTAILHSSPFRRLKHKTQVFFAPSNDHICTRMEHVLHVASIATAICRTIGLNDELAWAIGIGHDLGHTPFGHIGEKIISNLRVENGLLPLEHEVNSLRVVDFLSPLNLTYAVRDGIVSHCGESFIKSIVPDSTIKDFDKITTKNGIRPSTWEGCVVRFSDMISYMGRDYEDACRLGIVSESELPEICKKVLGKKNGEIIDTLVEDIIVNADKQGVIGFSDDVYEATQSMIQFNYKRIYKNDILDGYEKYYTRLIRLIYSYLNELLTNFKDDEEKYRNEGNMLSAGFYNYYTEKRDAYMQHDGNLDLLIFDYIAGMSDNFCLDCGNEILKPEHLNESIDRSLTGKWFDAR